VTVSDNAVGLGGTGGAPPGGGAPGANGQAGGGGGIADLAAGCSGACIRLANSIVAVNGGGNCSGSITDGLRDLVFGDSTCPGANADPKLRPLQNNGGPTPTMALPADSAAIDGVPAAGADCPASDQRGVARPQGAGCDIGAYELAPPVIAGASAGATSLTTATVTASVNPNVQDTRVLVRYGATRVYGSTTVAQDVGSADTAGPVSFKLSGLSPGIVYHVQLVATNADGSVSSSDLTFTTSTTSAGGLPAKRPVLSRVRQSARRWREGNRLASISAERRLPVGTTFTFAVNEPAAITFTFTQSVVGRRGATGCVSLSKRNARKRRCRATKVRGRLSLPAHQGVNQVRFQGPVARGRRLKPGTYAVAITAATPGAPPSAPAKLTFSIVGSGR
jgi:hypothetical protein